MDRLTPKNSDLESPLTLLCSTSDKPTIEDVDSVYEINIQSSVRLKINNSSSEKLALAAVAPVAIKNVSNESLKGDLKGLKVFANPFIESYYPTLKGTASQDNPIKSSMGNDIQEKYSLLKKNLTDDVNKQANCNDIFKERNVKEEENESISLKAYSKFKKNLKRQIIENFISKNEKKKNFKSFIQNNRAEDQLHLHHHEHHHHYYFDSPKTKGNNQEFHSTKRSSFDSQKLCSRSFKKMDKEKKFKETDILKENFQEQKNPTCWYQYTDCHLNCLPNVSLNTASVVTFVKSTAENSTKCENSSMHDYGKNHHVTKLKSSSSIDSVFGNRRSDLIMTHTYSETELSKYNKEGVNIIENFLAQTDSLEKLKNREICENEFTKNASKTDYNKLIKSLKKLDSFVPSAETKESKKGSKFSYIHCESMKSENLSWLNSEDKEVNTNQCPSNEKYGEKEISNPNRLNIVLKTSKNTGQIPGALPLYVKKSSIHFEQEKSSSKISIEKLKRELNEIKTALRHYEERRWNKTKKSLTFILKNDELMVSSPRKHGISVYSSKTFIMDAGKFSLSKILNRAGTSGKQQRSLCLEGKISYHLMSSRNYQKKLLDPQHNKRGSDSLNTAWQNNPKHLKVIL